MTDWVRFRRVAQPVLLMGFYTPRMQTQQG